MSQNWWIHSTSLLLLFNKLTTITIKKEKKFK